jgi:hypothetical protein
VRSRGKVIWPWPSSIAIDRDADIKTCLAAAMNFINVLAVSDMPRCEQHRKSLSIAYGLVTNAPLPRCMRRYTSCVRGNHAVTTE